MTDPDSQDKQRSWRHPFRRRAAPEPKEPFFKDERILHGRLRMDVSIRALLVGLVVFVALISGAVVYVLDQNDTIKSTQNGVKTTQGELEDALARLAEVQKNGRAARLEAQANTNAKVQDLACFLWNFLVLSPDPGYQFLAKEIDKKYDGVCTKLAEVKPGPRPKPGSGNTGPARPSGSASSARPPTRSPSSSRSSPTSSAPSRTRHRPAPSPSNTPVSLFPGVVSTILDPVPCLVLRVHC